MNVLFSLSAYDSEGDCVEDGVFLHFGDTRIKVGTTMEDLDSIIDQLKSIRVEIEETYPKFNSEK